MQLAVPFLAAGLVSTNTYVWLGDMRAHSNTCPAGGESSVYTRSSLKVSKQTTLC